MFPLGPSMITRSTRVISSSFLKSSSGFLTRSFHKTPSSSVFKKRVEEDIRYLIESLPPASRIYQNEDGTPRQPTDMELHKIAQLSLLSQKRHLRFWEYFTLSEADSKLYADNYTDILALLPNAENGASGDIIDKVPYEDIDGSIKWKIVRENENEGWEKLSYYAMVPGLLLLVGVHLFKDNDGIEEWAAHELKLRVLEQEAGQTTESAEALLNDHGKSKEELRNRDNLIVERILSGDYDKLANLQLRKPALSLIGDISEDLPK